MVKKGNEEFRERRAQYLKETRARENAARTGRPPAAGYSLSRDLMDYSRFMGKDIVEEIRGVVGRKGVAHVLDLGMGEGNFLRDVKKIFGNQVVTYGTCLTHPTSREGLDRVFVGDELYDKSSFQRFAREGGPNFDLIVSRKAGTLRASFRVISKKVLSKLAYGGVAHIQLGYKNPAYAQNLIDEITKYNFRVATIRVGYPKQGERLLVRALQITHPEEEDIRRYIHFWVNEIRRRHGLGELDFHEEESINCRAHAEAMAAGEKEFHSPKGVRPDWDENVHQYGGPRPLYDAVAHLFNTALLRRDLKNILGTKKKFVAADVAYKPVGREHRLFVCVRTK